MVQSASFSYWTGPKMIIRLANAVEKCRSPLDSTGKHVHPAHELILVKSGRIRVWVNDRKFELVPGNLLAISRSLRHEVRILEENTRFFNIMFRGKLFAELELNRIPLQPEEIHLADQLIKNAVPPFDLLRAELAVAWLSVFLSAVAYRVHMEKPVPEKIPANVRLHVSGLVLEVIEYMESHYQQPLTLSKTANHVGISASYLRHLLLKETGYGFSAHLQQIRIEQAKKLIVESPGNIKSIATECGFNSMAFFYKTFKRLAGTTPLEYGKSWQ